MALVDEVTATTLPHYEKEISDIYFRGCPVVERLKKNARVWDGGSEAHFPIRYQKVSEGFRWYVGNEVFDLVSGTHLSEAKTQWQRFQDNIAISRKTISENSGVAQIVNVLESSKESLGEGIQVNLARYVHGLDDCDIENLEDLFTTDGVYMNLDPADLTGKHPTAAAATSLWNPQINSSTTALDYEQFVRMKRLVSEGQKKWTPDFAYCNLEVFSAFEAEFQPQQRYQSADLLEAGWDDNIVVSKVPLVSTLYAKGTSRTTADNHLTMICSKSLFFIHLQGKEVEITKHDLRPYRDAIAFQALGNIAIMCIDRYHQGRFTTLQPSLFNA